MNKSDFSNSDYLNLRGTPCPVNFIRSSLAAEKLHNNSLQIDLDKGEPEEMVLSGLSKAGFCVKIIHEQSDWIRIMVTNSGKR